MEIPTTRELELEILVRQRDKRIAEYKVEVAGLRKQIQEHKPPSENEPFVLPPDWVAYLMPHILPHQQGGESSSAGSPLNVVSAALRQRIKALQQENDELYELMKQPEIAGLNEQVQVLKLTVAKLEHALKDSHAIIESLASELAFYDKTLVRDVQSKHSAKEEESLRGGRHSSSRSPPRTVSSSQTNHVSSKAIPTAPRAHKRQRLSPRVDDARIASSPRHPGSQPISPRGSKPHSSPNRRYPSNSRMEADKGYERRRRTPSLSPIRNHDRDSGRTKEERNGRHQRDRVRNSEREKRQNRLKGRKQGADDDVPERDAHRGRPPASNGSRGGDRGLVERMGLLQ